MRIRMATGEDAEQVTSVYAPYVEFDGHLLRVRSAVRRGDGRAHHRPAAGLSVAGGRGWQRGSCRLCVRGPLRGPCRVRVVGRDQRLRGRGGTTAGRRPRTVHRAVSDTCGSGVPEGLRWHRPTEPRQRGPPRIDWGSPRRGCTAPSAGSSGPGTMSDGGSVRWGMPSVNPSLLGPTPTCRPSPSTGCRRRARSHRIGRRRSRAHQPARRTSLSWSTSTKSSCSGFISTLRRMRTAPSPAWMSGWRRWKLSAVTRATLR